MATQAGGTGQEQAPKFLSEFIESINSTELSQREITKWVDRLPVSADVKVLIEKIAAMTMEIGQAVLKIGRIVLNWVISVVKAFPAISFGLILGALFGALIASIPLIGAVLSPVVMPLSLALGFALTVPHEIGDTNLRERVEQFVKRFEPFADKA